MIIKNKLEKNIQLNNDEFLNGNTILKSHPRCLEVILTNRCNIDCIMCPYKKERPQDLPYIFIKEISRYFPVIEHVMWSGGEVFLVDYFERLFDEASQHRYLQQWIVTHGGLINKKWAEKIAATNTNLIVSIDTAVKNTYEKIRRGASYDELIENIKNINK